MPLPASKPNTFRIAVLFAIVGAHIAVLSALLQLHSRSPVTADINPIAVRLISEPIVESHWQPPTIAIAVPVVSALVPDPPVIDLPLAAALSSTAISVPPVASARAVVPEAREMARLVTAVEYLREPEPRYPPQSRKLREQGMVVLRVLIDERGAACDVQIEASSGHERLDRAARDAVGRAEFRPYVEDGIVRRALVLIPIEFSLSRIAARVAANGA